MKAYKVEIKTFDGMECSIYTSFRLAMRNASRAASDPHTRKRSSWAKVTEIKERNGEMVESKTIAHALFT